jgi:hypothetical protein
MQSVAGKLNGGPTQQHKSEKRKQTSGRSFSATRSQFVLTNIPASRESRIYNGGWS